MLRAAGFPKRPLVTEQRMQQTTTITLKRTLIHGRATKILLYYPAGELLSYVIPTSRSGLVAVALRELGTPPFSFQFGLFW